jgi:hypothetical protein
MKAPLTINVANIMALADFIESEKFEFDMGNGSAFPECGTAGCIGGHSAVLWPDIREYGKDYLGNCIRNMFTWDAQGLATKLGIPLKRAEYLCFLCEDRHYFDVRMFDITRDRAVRVLRNLAATGEVVWDETS